MDGKRLVGIGLLVMLAIQGVMWHKNAAVWSEQGKLDGRRWEISYEMSEFKKDYDETDEGMEQTALEKEIASLREEIADENFRFRRRPPSEDEEKTLKALRERMEEKQDELASMERAYGKKVRAFREERIEPLEKEIGDIELELVQEKADQFQESSLISGVRWIGLMIMGFGVLRVLQTGTEWEKAGAFTIICLLLPLVVYGFDYSTIQSLIQKATSVIPWEEMR